MYLHEALRIKRVKGEIIGGKFVVKREVRFGAAKRSQEASDLGSEQTCDHNL